MRKGIFNIDFQGGKATLPKKRARVRKMRTAHKRFSRKTRNQLKKQYHYTCQLCGRKFPKSERHLLTLHHGDKKPYCRGCHDIKDKEGKVKRVKA